jgi:cytohesin
MSFWSGLFQDKATKIHDAVRAENFAKVRALAGRNKAYVSARAHNGDTPLHVAALKGSKEIAELLLANGADVNAKDEVGFTPLHHVGSKDVAKLLLAKGANVNAEGGPFGGMTPLEGVASYKDAEVLEVLIANGANVKVGGGRALHYAAFQAHLPSVKVLLANGADVNARNEDGETSLRMAKRRGLRQLADLLRQHGGQE